MPLLCTDIENFCFSHLWKLPSPVEFCCHILINKGKYQNILPMPVFANSPCCMLIGWFLWTEMLIPKMIMSEMAIYRRFSCQKLENYL